MQFTKLILRDYIPLIFRNLHYFEYVITSPWQIIIGTNGSGKSSVMRQLSPLPANSDDFLTKTGGKEVWFNHHGKEYMATSSFARGSHHELWDLTNNVNLNPGRTGTVQKRLVKELFGLDLDLMNVLIGVDTFTSMAPLERRDWLLELSQMDMDFSMRLYANLKTKLRDAQGVSKHLSKRLADEIEKLPKEVELEGLNDKVDKLTDTLSELLAIRIPKAPTRENTKKLLDEANAEVKRLSQHILKVTLDSPYSKGFKSVEEMDASITEMDKEYERANACLKFLYKEHSQYQDVISAMEAANVSGLEEFQSRIRDREIERDKIWKRCLKFKLTDKVDTVVALSKGVIPIIDEIITEIPTNYEQRFNKLSATELREQVMAARIEVSKLTNFVDDISHKLNHRQDASAVECPECHFTWPFGYSESEVQRYQVNLENNLAQLKAAELREKELTELERDQMHYLTCLRRLHGIFKQNPSMQMLWDAITENWQSGQYPGRISALLHDWNTDIHYALEVWERNKVIKEQQDAFTEATGMQSGSTVVFQEKMNDLQARINETLDERMYYAACLNDTTQYRKTVAKFLEDAATLDKLITKMDTRLNDYLTAISQEQLQELIAEHQKTLAQASQLLQRAAQSKAVIDDISRSREQSQRDAEVYAVLAQELSPVDGLIAEQLKHFIRSFVDQINKAIGYVWTYPLSILPCGHDDTELDYKFPLQCHGADKLVPDIAKGSSSQVDIVNFAFRLVVMLYKDMTDFPLYLDELAPSLDEKHRLNIMDFVKHLVETRRCSQLFAISHYMVTVSAMSRAEICVMDDTNILTLPPVFNKHIVMH